jgi:protein gp37
LTGCTKISPGCKHCYAERMARRLQAMGQPNYTRGFRLTVHEHALEIPLRWKRPQNVFVNSMSDLFHRKVSAEFIAKVFEVMGRAHWHRFQILTKRSARLAQMGALLPWHPNVWMGVSVESSEYADRIHHLREIPAALRFLSLEPLLGPFPNLDLDRIDWVVVGGESGPRARPIDEGWVAEIRDQCVAARVPFFFKQWGGVHKKRAGRTLQGRIWDQIPAGTPGTPTAVPSPRTAAAS